MPSGYSSCLQERSKRACKTLRRTPVSHIYMTGSATYGTYRAVVRSCTGVQIDCRSCGSWLTKVTHRLNLYPNSQEGR